MSEQRFRTFSEFYPFYLGEHTNPMCRRLHFTGTSLAAVLLAGALVTQRWWLILAALVVGYVFAWVGHFFFEKNRPATFTYPLWSLASDYRMTWRWLTGRLHDDLMRAGVPIRGA